MFFTKFKLALLISCLFVFECGAIAAQPLPITPTSKQSQEVENLANKALECKEFVDIVDQASGARGTTDLSVALRYVSALKQDLLTLKKPQDSQLKSLYDRYLPFATEMEAKLEKVKRSQNQGDYSALLAAVPDLTATGNKGLDLELELRQYCQK
jgi:hypothetical protein